MIESEEGYCWYVARLLFRDDTLKIGYDETGAIQSMAKEVDRMFPTGLSVVEIDPALAPEGLSVGGWWITGRNWCRWHWHNGRKNTG